MTNHVIHVERSGGSWEASFWHFDEQRYFRIRDIDPRIAAKRLAKEIGIYRPQIIIHGDEDHDAISR